MSGENLNYLVTTDDGQQYIFKIVDEDMPADVVKMENSSIEHALRAYFPYQWPQIINNRQSAIETGIELHVNPSYRLRLLTFVDGLLLSEYFDISAKIRFELGIMLARFLQALESLDHPAAKRSHRWNLVEADQHHPKPTLFEDPGGRQLSESRCLRLGNLSSVYDDRSQ